MDHAMRFGVIIGVIAFIVMFFYSWSLWSTLRAIPRDKHQFPAWFVWLFLLPFIGYIFQWMMIPFGIPNAIRSYFPTDQSAIAKADLLFKVGLAQLIFAMIGVVISVPPVRDISTLLWFALWIVYWVLIVKFKKAYLNKS